MNAILELSGIAGAMECLDATERRILALISHSDDEAYVHALGAFLQQIAAVRLQILKPSMQDQRSTLRAPERGLGLVKIGEGPLLEAAVQDISIGGAFIECDIDVQAGDEVKLFLPGFDAAIGAEVRGRRGTRGIHLAFERLDPERALTLLKRLERHFSRY